MSQKKVKVCWCGIEKEDHGRHYTHDFEPAEEKVEQPKVGELPALNVTDAERNRLKSDNLKTNYTGRRFALMYYCREHQLLAEQQVSAALRASLAEAIAQRDEERRNHKITLDREAATTTRYDAKIADIEAERDEALRILKEYRTEPHMHCFRLDACIADGYGDTRCTTCIAADEVLGVRA